MDEDAQPLEAIIAPVKKQIEADRGKNALELKVSEEYLRGLMGNANLVNVAVAGTCTARRRCSHAGGADAPRGRRDRARGR